MMNVLEREIKRIFQLDKVKFEKNLSNGLCFKGKNEVRNIKIQVKPMGTVFVYGNNVWRQVEAIRLDSNVIREVMIAS